MTVLVLGWSACLKTSIMYAGLLLLKSLKDDELVHCLKC